MGNSPTKDTWAEADELINTQITQIWEDQEAQSDHEQARSLILAYREIDLDNMLCDYREAVDQLDDSDYMPEGEAA